jgi:NAD(P)-dependent dehydrogenase (short-subunit alcohol dehydrogenase family)
VINGINTFLPVVQEAAKSRPTSIVITGSKQGITNPPGNVAYNASKSAVKTLAEHLSWDLRDTKTSVHLLVPGWTFTGMVSKSYPNILPFSSLANQYILPTITATTVHEAYVLFPFSDWERPD